MKAINVSELIKNLSEINEDNALFCKVISDKLVCCECGESPVWLCTFTEQLLCSEHLQKTCERSKTCPGCYGGYHNN